MWRIRHGTHIPAKFVPLERVGAEKPMLEHVMSTHKIFSLVAIAIVVFSMSRCAVEDSPAPQPVTPDDTAALVKVTDITPYSAVISGVFGNGVDSGSVAGIHFSMQNTKYINTTGTEAKATDLGAGLSSVELDGLYSDTTYYFTTYVEHNGVRYNSDIYSFRTHRLTAETDSATSVYAFGARLGLTLSEPVEAGAFRGAYGIYYSLHDRVIREQSTLCAAPYGLSALRPDQTYYYRAFVMMRTANLREVYIWGRVRSFHTPPIGVETSEPQRVTSYSATLGGNVNVLFTDVTDMGVLLFERNRDIKLDSVGVDSDQKIVKLAPTLIDSCGMGDFFAAPTGLKADKRYFFRAFAIVKEKVGNTVRNKEYYGDILEFKTQRVDISDNYVVDLGLSVFWSARNYGAAEVEDFGEYMTPSDGMTRTFSDGWRLPTVAEAKELIDSCNWSWDKYNGVEGVAVVSAGGSALFLPANMDLAGSYTYGVYMLNSKANNNGFSKSLRFVKDAFGEYQCGKSPDNDIASDAKVSVRLVKDK